MATFWINAGKLVVCAEGRFAVQADCPCAQDCYADVIAAIRERQLALGRTLWPAVPDPAKTIAQCDAEVNQQASSFYVPYVPSSSPPVKWAEAGFTATGITDFCDLLELIKVLQISVGSASISGLGAHIIAYSGSYETTVAAAIASAMAAQGVYGRTALAVANVRMARDLSDRYQAAIEWDHGEIRLSTSYTGMARTVTLYVKVVPGGSGYNAPTKVYDTQGDSWPGGTPYQWIEAAAAVLPAGTALALVGPLRHDVAPTHCTEPSAGTSVATGYATSGVVYPLVSWEFAYR